MNWFKSVLGLVMLGALTLFSSLALAGDEDGCAAYLNDRPLFPAGFVMPYRTAIASTQESVGRRLSRVESLVVSLAAANTPLKLLVWSNRNGGFAEHIVASSQIRFHERAAEMVANVRDILVAGTVMYAEIYGSKAEDLKTLIGEVEKAVPELKVTQDQGLLLWLAAESLRVSHKSVPTEDDLVDDGFIKTAILQNGFKFAQFSVIKEKVLVPRNRRVVAEIAHPRNPLGNRRSRFDFDF